MSNRATPKTTHSNRKNSATRNEFKKIVWAVDPFDPTVKSSAVQSTIRSIAGKLHSKVIPTYVLSAAPAVVFPDVNVGYLLNQQKGPIRKELSRRLKQLKLPNLSEPHVLVSASNSVSQAAEKLWTHAAREKADLIVVASHARKGLARFALGSFTETLTLQNKTPLLAVNPKTKVNRDIKEILFATDFAPSAEKAFQQIVSLAKALGARITIYHAVAEPTYPAEFAGIAITGVGWVPTPADIEKLAETQRAKAARWIARAELPAESARIVVETHVINVTDSILKFAKKSQTDLIAVEAKRRAAAATFLGSVARSVIRQSKCPVWISRTKA